MLAGSLNFTQNVGDGVMGAVVHHPDPCQGPTHSSTCWRLTAHHQVSLQELPLGKRIALPKFMSFPQRHTSPLAWIQNNLMGHPLNSQLRRLLTTATQLNFSLYPTLLTFPSQILSPGELEE